MALVEAASTPEIDPQAIAESRSTVIPDGRESIDDGGSLADHEAQYADGKPPMPVPDDAPLAKPRADNGRFEKHRAKSKQATPEDVAQIQTLTRQLREKEDELVKIKPEALAGSPRLRVLQRQIAAIEAELSGSSAQPTPEVRRPEPVTPASAPVVATALPDTFPGVEPKLDDFASAEDPYSAWQRALGRYDRAKERFEEQQQAQQRAEYDRQSAIAQGWTSRVQSFVATHPDYIHVIAPIANEELTPLMKAAIIEDDNGPAIAYYLAQQPQVFDDLLLNTDGKPVTAASVALLRRRLNRELSSPRVSAGLTGAATTPAPLRQPPAPPTPVRTGSTLTSGHAAPSEGASLAEHEQFFHKRRR